VAKNILLNTATYNGTPTLFLTLLQEYARDFVQRMYTDPSFNATYAPYLATLPTKSEFFTPEMWQQDHVAMLQTPALEMLADYARRSTEEIYYGNFSEQPYNSVPELLGGKISVDLNTFKWASAVIASRYFGAPLKEDSDIPIRILAPLLDFANHADEAHSEDEENAYQTTFNGAVQLRAKRYIKKGEEIKFNYQPGVVHRPDMSLLSYGFFQKSPKKGANEQGPQLCSVDLPTFSLEKPYEPTPDSDDTFYGPKGKYNTEEEYQRLENLLKEAPTTLEEDKMAKKVSQKALSELELLLLEFRIERKRGLLAAMEKIKRELQREREEEMGYPQEL
jgi:SET domain